MASSTPGGYDLDWVEDPPDDLKCLICLCVARDPQQHPGDDKNPCGKVFCTNCISEYKKTNTGNNCPNCRKQLTLFKDSRGARVIKALKVKCNSNAEICDWTGELGSLETHLQSCDYALVPCTNECKIDNKIAKFPKKDIEHHLANNCPRRQYECPHCQETGEHQERTTTHLDTCPKVRVHCPNTDCGSKILRCNLSTHLNTCEYEPVSCKYAAVGCNERPTRMELNRHEEDALIHLKATIEKNLELSRKVASLEKVTSHLRKSASGHAFKLTNYQQLKSDNKRFYSLPFYTSYLGYKLYLNVDANGDGDGAGTHVSVFAHLMKGDHDDTLTWPFTGSVTFELLNQLEDKNHHKRTVTFPADSEASKRVVDSERGKGWGFPQFISHTDLDYDASTNTQYLKDDTLVFRVSVKAPDHKPWLDCTL